MNRSGASGVSVREPLDPGPCPLRGPAAAAGGLAIFACRDPRTAAVPAKTSAPI